MTQRTVASFLTPEGFAQPSVAAVLREGSLVTEAGRYAVPALHGARRRDGVRRYGSRPARVADPVLLVPGFLAGDSSLAPMSRVAAPRGLPHLPRRHPRQRRLHAGRRRPARGAARGDRPAARHPGADRRATASAACSPAASRSAAPTSSSGIVTMGSPMLAPGAHHASLARSVDLLVRLNRAGVPGLMAEDCVAGRCARESFDAGARGAARRRRLHRDLLPPRRHRRLAGLRRPRGRTRSRCAPPTSGMAFDPG